MNITRTSITPARCVMVLAVLSLLSACGGSSGDAGAGETGATTLPTGVSNQAPTLSGLPQGQIKVVADVDFVVQAQATDADGDSLRFIIQNKPRWAEFDAESGRLRGRPRSDDVGRHADVIISVTDNIETTEGEPFDVVVDPVDTVNSAPVLTGTPATSVYAGSQYSFRPGASDADGDTLVFRVENLPTWATFNSSNGTLSGTPGAEHVGTSGNIRIGASDGADTTYTPVFGITVLAVQTPPSNSAPVLSGTPASSVVAGQSYSFTPVASDADGDALTFSIQNRPAWASFNPANGALSGTPTQVHVGTYSNIRISVTDGVQTTAGAAFSIQVQTGNRAPTLSGTPATSVRAGESYSFQPTAADADGDTLIFSVQNLPSWASFNTSSGAISGTPGEAHVGTYSNIRISVSDGTVSVSASAFSIEVTQVSLGQATLSWTAPTENMDGSALTDLAGYKLYFGTTEGNYTETITVDNPGILTYVVDNLTPSTYYFVATAYNSSGVESPFSGVAVKVVQ